MSLSGPEWVSQFPTSKSEDDLVEPFRTNAKNFLSALSDCSAEITISATYRPPQRAYLMHYCFQIANNNLDPALVDPYNGIGDPVDIDWVHLDPILGNPDPAASRAAAAAMVHAYGIAYGPVLVTRHSEGLAIDMNISWSGILTIVDGTGNAVTIASLPRTGANADLQAVGKSYGVIKLATDPPHWSSDGH
jgi:hypothetical protein